jgi:xanthine/CO dehydrogenase XdhC/CoxF family maturation factor
MTLTSLLELVPGPADSRVEYVVGGQKLEPAAREQAAQMLADDAMALRCGQSPALKRWRAVRDGRAPDDTVSAGTVLTYAAIGFGSPDKPAPPTHLQGLVAELLWNRLMKERRQCSGGRVLVKAHSVKPDPLEPGGDGLVVYRVGTTYVFRLWEIKKHDAKRPVSATINRASKQLARRGNEYLAKLAGPDTVEQRGPLGAFYAGGR